MNAQICSVYASLREIMKNVVDIEEKMHMLAQAVEKPFPEQKDITKCYMRTPLTSPFQGTSRSTVPQAPAPTPVSTPPRGIPKPIVMPATPIKPKPVEKIQTYKMTFDESINVIQKEGLHLSTYGYRMHDMDDNRRYQALIAAVKVNPPMDVLERIEALVTIWTSRKENNTWNADKFLERLVVDRQKLQEFMKIQQILTQKPMLEKLNEATVSNPITLERQDAMIQLKHYNYDPLEVKSDRMKSILSAIRDNGSKAVITALSFEVSSLKHFADKHTDKASDFYRNLNKKINNMEYDLDLIEIPISKVIPSIPILVPTHTPNGLITNTPSPIHVHLSKHGYHLREPNSSIREKALEKASTEFGKEAVLTRLDTLVKMWASKATYNTINDMYRIYRDRAYADYINVYKKF